MNTLIALMSAFSIACYYVYVSGLMKRRAGLSSGIVLAGGHIVAALSLVPFLMPSWQDLSLFLSPAIYIPMLLASLLLIVSRQLYYYAYAHTEVAHITVFSALTPVYALGAAYVMLDEMPSAHSLIGLCLIVGGIYAVFLRYDSPAPVARNMLGPFLRIARSKPVAMAFLSTIPTAFAAVFQKQLLATLDPFQFSFALLLIVGVASLLVELVRAPASIRPGIARLPREFWAVSALLLALSHVLFCMVMQTQHTAISLVLQRSAIVFQILLAYHFIGEKDDLKKRIIASCVIMLGFTLIMLPA